MCLALKPIDFIGSSDKLTRVCLLFYWSSIMQVLSCIRADRTALISSVMSVACGALQQASVLPASLLYLHFALGGSAVWIMPQHCSLTAWRRFLAPSCSDGVLYHRTIELFELEGRSFDLFVIHHFFHLLALVKVCTLIPASRSSFLLPSCSVWVVFLTHSDFLDIFLYIVSKSLRRWSWCTSSVGSPTWWAKGRWFTDCLRLCQSGTLNFLNFSKTIRKCPQKGYVDREGSEGKVCEEQLRSMVHSAQSRAGLREAYREASWRLQLLTGSGGQRWALLCVMATGLLISCQYLALNFYSAPNFATLFFPPTQAL